MDHENQPFHHEQEGACYRTTTSYHCHLPDTGTYIKKQYVATCSHHMVYKVTG